jgi:2-polyprenyl-6-methoxyphenol hydroxylase-like FAD-dependent oxidoreductase
MLDATHEITPKAAPTRKADVVIVGAGLCGSVAAVVLGRAGYKVVLVDRRATCPPQFRVEGIDGKQAELFDRLGLLEPIAAVATRFDHIMNARRGRPIDYTHEAHYGLRYEDFVGVVRSQLPSTVELVIDRVADLSTGPEQQQVILAEKGTIDTRLVVLATGFGDVLREKLGITRIVTFEKHSIPFGFDISPAPGFRFPFSALTYYGETAGDGIDYLIVFPIGAATRANLFTFRDDRDPWLREFRRAPKEVLLATLPGLAHFLGDFEIQSPVQSWVMSLCEVGGHIQQGVVLVGDSFQNSCPAAGTGVTRLLTDVDRLRRLAPAWLATPGMGRDKIAQFYADPKKQAVDRSAIALARYRRELTLDNGLLGRARRQQHFLRRRLAGWIRGDTPAKTGT